MKIKINTKIIGNCLAIRMRVRKGERERETDRQTETKRGVGGYLPSSKSLHLGARSCVCVLALYGSRRMPW